MNTEVVASKKVLVSGGSGFVGSAIVRALTRKYPGCAVTTIDCSPPRPQHGLPEKITCMQVDVGSADEVNNAFQVVKPDVVIHTAGIVPALADRFSRKLERKVWEVNVGGTQNMLEAAATHGVEAFVYTSSCCVTTDDMRMPYPNINEQWPTSRTSLIYGESKAAAEALVLKASNSNMVTCSLRPSVLCGPGDHQLIPAVHACMTKHETPFVIGDGLNLWDVTYVDNVADAHVLAVENLVTSRTAAGEAFFVQNNEPITFRDFCLATWAHFGHIPPFEIRIPEVLAYILGLMSEMATWVTGKAATLSRGSVRDACAIRYASGDKARETLGYEARVGIEEAIRLSCEDYARRIGVDLPTKQKERVGNYSNGEH